MKKKINFQKYSSIKIGNTYDVYVITHKQELNEQCFIIGGCNNIIVGDSPPPLAILSKEFDYIKIKDNKIIIGGATPSGKIFSFCKKYNIGGFEFLSHLPGTLGGLIKMNAGLKNFEIFDNLLSVTTSSKNYHKDEISYGYRSCGLEGIIFEASFLYRENFDYTQLELLSTMRKNQPKYPSAGSCFKNPKGDYAGRLIEEVGLKGKKIGNIGWSEIHANFLVNYGGGSYKDAIFLIQEAIEKVYKKFSIVLELEIIILDQNFNATPA